MISICVVCANPMDATSFYRGAGPMSELRKVMNVTNVYLPQINWASIRNADVVFMQRPVTHNEMMILETAKMNKKKIWVDYDDYLLGVPPWNPASTVYDNPEIQKNIKTILKHADVVTVSTKFLKHKYTEFNANIHVVPNAFDDTILNFKQDLATFPVVTWRGSHSHCKDLDVFTPAMCEVAAKYEHWNFLFMGEPLWQTVEKMKQVNKKVSIVPNKEPTYYFKTFQSLRPSVHVVPLIKDDFNLCKSNISWIEGTFAGATCLVPDWYEWQVPGAVNYTDENDFKVKLDELIKAGINQNDLYLKSKAYIEENLLLSKVTVKRKEILESLL